MNLEHTHLDTRIERLTMKAPDMTEHIKLHTDEACFFYGTKQVLFDNTLTIPENRVTAIIGPLGSGKTTHIRIYNRIYEIEHGNRASGSIIMNGQNILDPSLDVLDLRRRIGMLFDTPILFPMSVFDNVAYGLHIHYSLNRLELTHRVEQALHTVGLFEEVKDSLRKDDRPLSRSSQVRLCLARALVVEPEVLLMDEPTATLDPESAAAFEELLETLSRTLTIILVTQNLQQAARISDYTAFMYEGRIVEFDTTKNIFTRPKEKTTEDYISGLFW